MTLHKIATLSTDMNQDNTPEKKDWDVILASVRSTSDTLRRVCNAED